MHSKFAKGKFSNTIDVVIPPKLITPIVPERPNFPEEEEKVLKYWQEIDAFKKQLKLSEGKPLYTFYDGPPFATGLPHYGHIAAGTIKVSLEA
jgi:isoleucyl-tRNA synthetase